MVARVVVTRVAWLRVVVVAVVEVVISLWLWLLLWFRVADFVNPGFESWDLWLHVTAVVVVAVLLT